MAGYETLWRQVLGQLGSTQAEQAEALGVAQQSISEKVRGRRSPPAATRWALAMAAAASMEGERARRRVVARALTLMEMADAEESDG